MKPQKLEKIALAPAGEPLVSPAAASRSGARRVNLPDDAHWGHGLLEAVKVSDDVAREGNFPPRKPLISRETGKDSRSTVRFADSRAGMRAESAARNFRREYRGHPDAARRRQDRLRPRAAVGWGNPR